MGENRGRKKKGNRLLSKFLKVFLLAFTVLALVVGIGAGIYILLADQLESKETKENGTLSDSEIVTDENGTVTKSNDLEKITTFAIFGTDVEGYRTDVVMLLFFNKDTKKINIISIPRDTMVSIPDDLYESILAKRSDMSKTIKVNEIPAYVEKDERNESSVKVLESMLGYDIDYFMTLNLDGFKTIVDLVGPIEVNIPFDMVYSDPVQDLYINLKAGVQEINGAQAEELIRYRKGYNNGDLGRIDMQHEFMMAFVKKLLSVENKMNIVNIVAAVLVNLETNFDSAIKYVNYIDDISVENITIDVLPGEAQMLDRSYFVYDYEATKLLLNNIVNGTLEPVDPETLIDAKTLSISVQNGAGIAGLAKSFKEKLEGEGYLVAEATDYTSSDVVTTKLRVPTQAVGDELATYFNNPEIEVDKTLLEQEHPIIIVVGESDGEE